MTAETSHGDVMAGLSDAERRVGMPAAQDS
jgi:hypothetical protein